jgi:protein-S-isoprenylcysteine O-methyltransferase Ste14
MRSGDAMEVDIADAGKLAWVLGIIAWYVIRYPFERRAKRVAVLRNRRSATDRLGLGAALLGLAVVPAIYVATGFPAAADFRPPLMTALVGVVVFIGALWLFRVSHKHLGRNWSISLEIREQHVLVASGVYALIRHPMYTSFMLMGIGQLLLIPNWFAGIAGLVGFSILFFLRVEKEEKMMEEVFGSQYSAYARNTKRLIPYIY